MAKRSRCECGRVKAKDASRCVKCSKDRLDALRTEARAIVRTGKCPRCGAALRRNLSLSGWWQCEQLGAEGFRKDASRPSCSFDCFTE